MDKKLGPEESEMLRVAILEYLGSRHPLTWTKKQIAQGLKMRSLVDFTFSEQDLDSAIAVLSGKKFIESDQEELGSTLYFRASADGLIEWERRH